MSAPTEMGNGMVAGYLPLPTRTRVRCPRSRPWVSWIRTLQASETLSPSRPSMVIRAASDGVEARAAARMAPSSVVQAQRRGLVAIDAREAQVGGR